MKKIFLIFMFLISPLYAAGAEIPKDLSEYFNKPYVGMPYEQALRQEIPFLLVFAKPNNIVSLARLAPIAEMVYDEFKGQYNFCIINTKISDNDELTDFFNPKKLPALYIIDTQEKTYTHVEKKYYNKRDLRKILTEFKEGTLF